MCWSYDIIMSYFAETRVQRLTEKVFPSPIVYRCSPGATDGPKKYDVFHSTIFGGLVGVYLDQSVKKAFFQPRSKMCGLWERTFYFGVEIMPSWPTGLGILNPPGSICQKMVEWKMLYFLGPSMAPGEHLYTISDGKTFSVKRWTRTSAKYDMMMSWLPDISASPS